MSKKIWIGDFGDYEIPEKYQLVKIKKNGMPDKRCALSGEFLEWAAQQDQCQKHQLAASKVDKNRVQDGQGR